MCSVTSLYGLYTHPAAMVSNYCTPRDIRPMFCSHQVSSPYQILELRENNALLSQRSSVAGHALELSYPLSGIHSIH